MRTESTENTWLVDFSVLHRWSFAAAAYWFAITMVAAAIALVWFRRGPDRVSIAVVLAVWTWFLGPGVGIPVLRRLPAGWLRVPRGERFLHQVLGVKAFGWLLERSGYNRRSVYTMWRFSANREGMRFRAQAAQGGVCAHGACFGVHALLAAVAWGTGHPKGAVWMLAPGVVMHLYPVLLQRSILLRLQPLLNRGKWGQTPFSLGEN